MKEDKEGFSYPFVDVAKCVECGACDRVCPAINNNPLKQPMTVYAAKSKNEEIRRNSSSGGVFTLLAENILNDGGVVFGCAFDDAWEARQVYVERKEELVRLRGSKYMQSVVGCTFKQTKEFLEQGRSVLYSGTPCQIAGLKNYLGKDYTSLLTVDIICHGVPSVEVWRKYLDYVSQSGDSFPDRSNIDSISFRNKSCGWKNFSLSINYIDRRKNLNELFSKNKYFRLFLDNMILRPSCEDCPARSGRSASDITLGDFWGIEKILPDFDDDKGCSVLIINSDKGQEIVNEIECGKTEVDLEDGVKENPVYHVSVSAHQNRNYFFSRLRKTGSFKCAYDDVYSLRLDKRLRRKLFAIVRHRSF